jgi:DNA-binding NarL/FixJ family response regulator
MAISVLLVDKNRSFLLALHRLLETIPGVNIIADAQDGYAALKKAELLAPDLMIIETTLGELSGMATVRLMRNWPKRPQIVFLSIDDVAEYIEEAHDIIDAKFVEKADVVTKLIPIIERMIEEESA